MIGDQSTDVRSGRLRRVLVVEVSLALNDLSLARYEQAYARHASEVHRFLLAWTNDWSESQDLTQETYIRLWQRRATIDWDRPILPWLLTVAKRLATSRFRSIARRIMPARSVEFADESIRVRWMDVREALVVLSPLERVALTMTAMEGLASAQIAEVLHKSPGAVRAALSRAREKLEAADA